jgi:DNA-binding transcriptional MerR regulator
MGNKIIAYQSKETQQFEKNYLNKTNELSAKLNDKSKRISAEDVSYRIVNYWEKEGLLISDRVDGKGWRKYSLLDILWLQLLVELRKFGYPVESLKKLKEKMTEVHPLKKTEAFVNLEVYAAMAITNRVACWLHVLPNGNSFLTTQKERQALENAGIFYNNSAINISLNYTLSQITKKDFSPIDQTEVIYDDEFELLSLMRLIDCTSFTVHFKNGKAERFEAVEYLANTAKISDLLRQTPYQRIELLQQDGGITQVKRTITKKIKS